MNCNSDIDDHQDLTIPEVHFNARPNEWLFMGRIFDHMTELFAPSSSFAPSQTELHNLEPQRPSKLEMTCVAPIEHMQSQLFVLPNPSLVQSRRLVSGPHIYLLPTYQKDRRWKLCKETPRRV